MSHKTPPRAYLVVFGAVGVNLVLGALYAWSVIAKKLAVDWHWTKAQTSMPFTASTISFAITMIFAGRLQDRIGPRLVAMMGSLFGLGLLTSAFVHDPSAMMLTYGVLGGIGLGLGYAATTPAAIKWFSPSRKGLIAGIVVSGVGIASVYVSPLTQWLLGQVGIYWTFIWLGGGATVVIFLMSMLIRNPQPQEAPPAVIPAASTMAKAVPASGGDLDYKQVLASGRFYLLWLMFTLSASAGLMIIAHVATIAKEQAAWQMGFAPVAALAAFNTSGRVVAGFLSDRIGRPTTMLLAFVVKAANMFAFSYYTSPELVLLGASVAGLCYGTIFTLMPAATADFYGVRNLGVNYGMVFTGFGVAGAIGPLLGGWRRDRTGSFDQAYVMAGVLLLASAALSLVIARSRRRAAPATLAN